MYTTPEEVIALAHRLVEQYLPGWRFDLDSAKRRAGRCWTRRKLITLSKWYIALNLDKPDDLLDTILHEIAHGLCEPGEHHGPAWKAMCVKIGAKPERCFDSNYVVMPPRQYEATCPTCKRKFSRHNQMPKNKYNYCLKCGVKDGRLTYVRVGETAQQIVEPVQPTANAIPLKVKPLNPTRSK